MRILQQKMQIPLEGLQWRFLPHFADGEADAAVAGDSLTTTHGEAGLPTSSAQRGGLREVGARGRSLELRSGDLSCQALLEAALGFVLVKVGALGSCDL
jgi:hypothetical protein